MVQGKEAHRIKFDIIGLNAYMLQYLYSNCNLSALEGMDNMGNDGDLELALIPESFRTDVHL